MSKITLLTSFMQPSNTKSFNLSSGMVDVWYIDVNNCKKQIPYYTSLLSTDEKLKADKFKFINDKNIFIVARGVLRVLLAKYLSINPKKVEFKYGDFGKPETINNQSINFNISHSGKMAIFGFTKSHDIGVDIEEIKNNFDVLDIANNFFSKKEIEFLNNFPTEDQTEGFYRCWTRKESFIKAKSIGLSYPLDSFSVSIDSHESAELLETQWDIKEKHNWTLFSFSPYENYIGAISVKGNVKAVKYFNFNKTDINLLQTI
ncbi:4'-phosphopantetheinyl transferase family protein [Confluentibacter flavum]|uniref:Phosphopantetheine-protein transferase n=1 Tax=Confluentibacter flavum TaxID=1909700 RepID=A0A2N3HGQ5_9FLAO|nr:4'-phosphopantetheinyl transferase superfamily protein [Confluentibacter flavum]PKQ44147.1 phosphopantetheine-protein transferase [Confluentibacter flavum]